MFRSILHFAFDILSQTRSIFLSDPVRPVDGVEDADGVDDARPSVRAGPYGPSVASFDLKTTIDAPSVDDSSAPASSGFSPESRVSFD